MKPDPDNAAAIKSIDNIAKDMKHGLRQGMGRVGIELIKTANAAILDKASKTGKVSTVTRGRSRRRHRASAPGESFASLSGAARKQLGFDVNGAKGLQFGFRKDVNTEYTEILETKLNRPTLLNSITKVKPDVIKILNKSLKKAGIRTTKG